MKQGLFGALSAIALAAMMSAAQAGGVAAAPPITDPVFNWTFASANFSGSGQLNAEWLAGDVYHIISGSGTVTTPSGTFGVTFAPCSSLPYCTIGTYAGTAEEIGFDDLLTPSNAAGAQLSYWGVALVSTQYAGAINAYDGPSQVFAGGSYVENLTTPFTVSATPEASVWAMLVLGFGMIGMTLRGGRKSILAHAV